MRLPLDEARGVVEGLGASISVGVDDRCVLRNAEHRERYVSGLRLACTLSPHPGTPGRLSNRAPGRHNSIPRHAARDGCNWTGVSKSVALLTGDRRFESVSLQQRVCYPKQTIAGLREYFHYLAPEMLELVVTG